VFYAAIVTLIQGTNVANKWDKHLSQPSHVTNGIRQGRVLRPYLFNI